MTRRRGLGGGARSALIASVVVHVGVVVWAASDVTLPAPAVVAANPSPAPMPTQAPPTELAIEFLPDIVMPARSSESLRAAAGGFASATRTTTTASGLAPSETTRDPGTTHPSEPKHSPLNTMRKPDLGVSPELVAKFLSRETPLPPIPDLPGARIDAEIADVRARIRSGHHSARDWETLGALHDARAAVELSPKGGGRYEADKKTFVAKVAPDGTVHFKDKPNLVVHITPLGISGEFDVTDAVMRSHGMDPYAAAKKRFLERTFDQRVAIGEAYRHEQLSHSAELMQKNVARLWAMTADNAARKQGLFELWDECAETGSDDLVAGGAAARELVLGFIQSKLRGTNAYTADELARLNAKRRSAAVFAP